jgi:NADPH:quinone reductase-like Zn-dependent oxidoreductase
MAPKTMLEAIVHPDLFVEVKDSPVPTFAPYQVLIKVSIAGINPRDWKAPAFSGRSFNCGADIAGTVAAVGDDVLEFKVGDRVAAFHQIYTTGAAFAEFALAPSWTTFHLPKTTGFEEVSVCSLAQTWRLRQWQMNHWICFQALLPSST